MYYPVGQKFPRNRSVSYGFQDIHTFSFSTKIQDGRQKWRKLKFLNSIGQGVFELESENRNVDIQTDKKWTNKQTELHQFQKEPSYDGDLSPCQV